MTGRQSPLTKNRRPTGVRMDTGLTPQQEAYCRCRAMGMTIQAAVESLGGFCSPKTAEKWEKTDSAFKRRIAELSAIADKNAILKTGLDREWVISRLQKVVERCMQAEPVVDRQGTPTGEYKFDSSGANAALKMLGDTLGMFRAQEKKEGDEYSELSDDEIQRIAFELAQQTGLMQPPAHLPIAHDTSGIIDIQPAEAPPGSAA